MNPRVIEISGFDLEDPLLGRLELKLQAAEGSGNDLIVTTEDRIQAMASNFNAMTLTEYTREFRAPVSAGEVMGTLSYYTADGSVVVYNLVATRSVAARESLAPSISEIMERVENDPNPFPRFTFELFFVFIFLPLLAFLVLILLIRKIRKHMHKRTRIHTMNPRERYYQ